MRQWDKMDRNKEPSQQMMGAYTNNPLWETLCEHVESVYQTKPIIEYSGCSAEPGWNMKYKKAGRSLCTLYPKEGFFTVLVVIGEREKEETERQLGQLTNYTQELYAETKEGMGQRWLMIDVEDEEVLEDVKQLIAIRRNSRKK